MGGGLTVRKHGVRKDSSVNLWGDYACVCEREKYEVYSLQDCVHDGEREMPGQMEAGFVGYVDESSAYLDFS